MLSVRHSGGCLKAACVSDCVTTHRSLVCATAAVSDFDHKL